MTLQRPNIILIVIDALRARNLGCYGMPGNPSPTIDSLARDGVLFEDTYSCWNTTDQSLTSILTGKYPRSHGIMNHGDKVTREEREQFARTGTRLLAEILEEHGYTTAAVDWMGRWFKRGFDYYGYKGERPPWQRIKHCAFDLPRRYLTYMWGHLPIFRCYTPVRRPSFKDLVKGAQDVLSTFAFSSNLAQLQDAASVTGVAREVLSRPSKEPFFLFLHYWDTHTPYHCPRSYIKNREKITDAQSLLSAKYHGAVTYVDAQLRKLVAALQRKNLLDDTLVIITSDHGDSLTEHDIYFDHHGLYRETTHCPLILRFPDKFAAGTRVKGFVQHIDLVPTICDMLDTNGTERHWDGYSLLPMIRDGEVNVRDSVFIEESYVQQKSAIRTRDHTYIHARDGTGWCNYCQKVHVGKEELYDLENDPREMHDISGDNESLAQSMNDKLFSIIESLDKKRERSLSGRDDDTTDRTDTYEYDQEEEELIKRRLKDLGYFS